MYGAADVALMMAGPDGTVEVVWGSARTLAYFDMPGAEVLGGVGISNDYTITMGAAALPGLKRGDAVTVDGDSYEVARVQLLDDGVLVRAALRKV